MMVNTRLSKDDDELFETNYFRNSHYTSTDSSSSSTTTPSNMYYSRQSRTNTLFSSPMTDAEVRSRSDSVPISPVQHLDRIESLEIAQMEMELQFKTLEMLALIKGTTPRLAYEAERLDEVRSQRERSIGNFEEDLRAFEQLSLTQQMQLPGQIVNTTTENDFFEDEYLIGQSYEEEHAKALISPLETLGEGIKDLDQDHDNMVDNDDDGEDEDIFGMEL